MTTFRELAERHGFGHLAMVAPIKPAPILAVDETHGIRTQLAGWKALGEPQGIVDCGTRTWT